MSPQGLRARLRPSVIAGRIANPSYKTANRHGPVADHDGRGVFPIRSLGPEVAAGRREKGSFGIGSRGLTTDSANASTSRPRGSSPFRNRRANSPTARQTRTSSGRPRICDHSPRTAASNVTIADKTCKLPARQVLEEIKQLAVPGDDPHLGRNRPILQGMSVDHRHACIIFDRPAQALGRPAERDFFVIKEEILVHSAQRGDHRRVDEHARAGDPIDGPGTNSPTGLVFPAGARYELLPDGPGQVREDAHRALGRAVGVAQAEPDDPRRTVGIGFVDAESREDLAQKPSRDFHIWIEDQEPGASRDSPAGVDAGGEPSLCGRATSRKPGQGTANASGTGPREALSTTTI